MSGDRLATCLSPRDNAIFASGQERRVNIDAIVIGAPLSDDVIATARAAAEQRRFARRREAIHCRRAAAWARLELRLGRHHH